MATTNTIGTGVGRDYSTIVAWEAATDIDLGTSGGLWGEMYHDATAGEPTWSYSSTQALITISGAFSFAGGNRYRRLFAASGHKFDPVKRTGVWILRQLVNSSSAFRDVFDILESYFRMEDIAIIDDVNVTSTSGFTDIISVRLGTDPRLTGCWVQMAGLYGDGTAGTASGACYRISNDAIVANCVAVGGETYGNRGANYGFRIDATADATIIGCTAWGIVGWNESSPAACRGIDGNNDSVILNSIASRDVTITQGNSSAWDIVGITSDSQGLVTSDGSGAYGYGAENNNAWNVVPSELFVSKINNDLRLLTTAPAQDWHSLQVWYNNWGVTVDFAGSVRSTVYADIGAYGGPPASAGTGPPTEVISTIGSGGDYASVAAWVTATSVNLLDSNEVHIGEVIGSLSDVDTLATISGAITDATHYRVLRPQKGNEYLPASDTGCTLSTTGTSTSSWPVIKIEEKFFRLEGPMKITLLGIGASASVGTGGVVIVEDESHYVQLNALWITTDSSAALATFFVGILFNTSSIGGVIKNCVIWGHDGADNKSLYGGIRVRGAGTNVKLYNCTVWGTKLLATTFGDTGIEIDSSTGCEVRNCIVIDTRLDFDVPAATTRSNNISSDGSATGDDSITGGVAGSVFKDTSARNFYLEAGVSVAREAGYDLHLAGVLRDASGNGRYTPYDIGALEGAKPYPRFPLPKTRMRVCTCYDVVRTDGHRLRLTDNSTPIEFMGSTWEPMSFDASARRREIGVKASNLEIRGAITSDKITLTDLRAGRYQGATITEYLIDWRYPHLEPLLETRYQIEETMFSNEDWSAKVKGLPFILQNKVGDVYGRTCRYVLGDDDCRATYTVESGKAVLDVVDERRVIYVGSTTLSNTTTGWYALGKLLWLTGANAKLIEELYSSELIEGNMLDNPNQLIDAAPGWSDAGDITTSGVGNGFDTGVSSWLFERGPVATWGGMNSTTNMGTWSDTAPLGTKVCLSVWVKRPSSTPASYCELTLVQTTSSQVQHRALFEWTGAAWTQVADENEQDAGVNTTAAQHPTLTSWWRLSVGLTTTGMEGGSIQVLLRVGWQGTATTAASTDLEFSQTQFETGVLEPTSWVNGNKHKLVFAVPTRLPVSVGDTFDLDPGCDKLRLTCKDKFSNVKNYGGFPYIPGTDKLLDTPTQ